MSKIHGIWETLEDLAERTEEMPTRHEEIRPFALALDLDSTLIDEAYHTETRPGLEYFLRCVDKIFDRIVIFTARGYKDAKQVIDDIITENPKLELLKTFPVIDWQGVTPEGQVIPKYELVTTPYKDLRHVQRTLSYAGEIPLTHIFILDDDKNWINPEQIEQWVQADKFYAHSSQADQDKGLFKALAQLLEKQDIVLEYDP